MADSGMRLLLILGSIPQDPSSISTPDIQQRLQAEGETGDVSRRQIQRDLVLLSTQFPIQSRLEGKKQYWSFPRHYVVTLPGISLETAITFDMVDHFLSPLMPTSALAALKPHVESARKRLDQLTREGKTRWSDKVRSLPRGFPLMPAAIKPEVLPTVYKALMDEKSLYIQRTDKEEELVHPLGVVHRGDVIYLVCFFTKHNQVRQLALHRILTARVGDDKRYVPPGFSLDSYIKEEREFEIPVSNKKLKLKLRFFNNVGQYIIDTPISADQTSTQESEETHIIHTSAADTSELRWWLLSFGCNVEVMAPAGLRKEFQEVSQELTKIYRSK